MPERTNPRVMMGRVSDVAVTWDRHGLVAGRNREIKEKPFCKTFSRRLPGFSLNTQRVLKPSEVLKRLSSGWSLQASDPELWPAIYGHEQRSECANLARYRKHAENMQE